MTTRRGKLIHITLDLACAFVLFNVLYSPWAPWLFIGTALVYVGALAMRPGPDAPPRRQDLRATYGSNSTPPSR